MAGLYRQIFLLGFTAKSTKLNGLYGGFTTPFLRYGADPFAPVPVLSTRSMQMEPAHRVLLHERIVQKYQPISQVLQSEI